MKRYLPMLCAVLAVHAAHAQYMQSNGPAPAPSVEATTQQSAHPELDGKCKAVRPGDTVHFTLNIRSIEYARAVYADLQMHQGRSYTFDRSGLPAPDFRSIGGGGVAMRDAKNSDDYHFTFTVPRDVMSGIYYGSGVYVTAADRAQLSGNGARNVEITSRTLRKVRDYCLIVVSPYGDQGRPLVTDFKGGPIDRKVASAADAPVSSRIYLPTR